MVGKSSGTRMMFCFNTYCHNSSKNVLQRPTVDNAFKSKNGFKILDTHTWNGTLLTHWVEDNRVRRGKATTKGATVILWRLAGGDEDELLAPRVLWFVFVAMVISFKSSRPKNDGPLLIHRFALHHTEQANNVRLTSL